jgi:ketosteroid isomerase-like protein
MSEENVEIVQRLFSALADEDFRLLLALFAPNVEWVPHEGSYQGPEGVVKHMAEWIEPWDEHSISANEIITAGDRVLAVVHLSARGTGSGMEIDQDFFQLYTISDGKIVRMVEFLERADALEAAGLAE